MRTFITFPLYTIHSPADRNNEDIAVLVEQMFDRNRNNRMQCIMLFLNVFGILFTSSNEEMSSFLYAYLHEISREMRDLSRLMRM